MNITVGADPELFVLDQQDRYINPRTFLPGTKEKPYKVENGAVQMDGFAAEFNIDPVEDVASFQHNIETVMQQLLSFFPVSSKMSPNNELRITKDVAKNAEKEQFNIGCEPDYNAYSGSINQYGLINSHIRHSGGHVHIGWTQDQDLEDPDHLDAIYKVVRGMDVWLGVPMTYWDKQRSNRCATYGRSGCFRPKPYGVEYRSLSNFWLTSPILIRAVFNRTRFVIREAQRDAEYLQRDHQVMDWITYTIDSGCRDINRGRFWGRCGGYLPTTKEEYLDAKAVF